MASDHSIEELAEKKRQQFRRMMLLKLLRKIQRGEIDSSKVPLDELYQMHTGSRKEYQSPADRSQYNYGYMEIDEMMAGTPNYK